MQKKANTLLLILSATIINVGMMSLLFLLVYGVYNLMAGRFLSPGINMAVIFILFAASVVATYFIHKAFMRILLKKTGIAKHIHPAFLPGQPEKKPESE